MPDLRLPSQPHSNVTASWPVLIFHPAVRGGWVRQRGWLFTRTVHAPISTDTVTHLSANRVRCIQGVPMKNNPATIDRYLLPARRSAANQPHAAAAVDRRDRQTNGRTDWRTPDRYTDPASHSMRAGMNEGINVPTNQQTHNETCRQTDKSHRNKQTETDQFSVIYPFGIQVKFSMGYLRRAGVISFPSYVRQSALNFHIIAEH